MKKSFLVLFLVVALCFILTGCDSNRYEKANELFSQGEYQEAFELYQKLGDYEDSVEKAKECEREIGMRTHADYEFLEKLEQSILERLETTSTENFDRSAVVNTELTYIEKFKNEEFYDSKLKKIAKKYIKGLNIQKESLTKEYEYEYQIEWQRGVVYRFEALKDAYENYGFLKDNEKFIGTYISRYEDQKKLLDAYDAIEADIDSQVNSDDFMWYVNGNTMTCTIKNNTKYTYSTVFEYYFYDKNDTLFESGEAYIENIKPNSSYDVNVYISNVGRLYYHSQNNYYTDVKY